ncbi:MULTISPECIES: PilZ domain-containing protein [Psychrobacter]|jgi:type IV pilus assembly protein PilZ|uniref:PilZ domain-containing protein n=1 Tax=Psychrobacter TaxID=497 RepID=UPI0004346B65|nr:MULTISPECIES: PilZ domain-containing protein [Psychrobacter]MBE8608454.1 PilZ domain-containing protein [Pseudomonas lundensis]MCG3872607.1 PilZ domain-containing protein [Psychrobacter sp. Ps7]MDN5561042.1 PilZ domain-containing protein [Psychrobacter sp.]WLG14787.1 PilZ domain-containing protein [Psychrobacter cibarius]GAF58899.1 type IV pilus biogenesis protein PilZ [Psychrobacter sp. JCM 18902]
MAMPGRGGILTCHIENIEMLYASYLSFVSNGALFVPSNDAQQLGNEVFIAITLPNSSERLPMNGKVVWINAKTQGGRPAGFAVQIGTDIAGQRIKNEVERLLAGKIDGLQSTYTM